LWSDSAPAYITRRHHRQRWYPDLFERNTYETWQAGGTRAFNERAVERVEEILISHEPESLPDEVRAKLEEIVRQARRGSGM